ncbi:ABC transporter substrate-binding protein [Bradyrhizobium sp.]|jgi:putative tryptophan/tyrosine transport system substrate-binding protein|uniref:ABC transporter substrate-binding protein n=1 Tax=Bradyrhizobium sp. TaxID=376 RepID=UPI003C771B61
MRRREFIRLLGSVAALPLAAHAQQPMPVVGFIGGGFWGTGDGSGGNHFVEAFRSGLREMGFIEGQNVAIEYRFAENRLEGLPELVADLIRRRVAVICTGNNVTTLAVKKATSEIPLVFVFGLDPVLMGLVSTINRPGGNATGVSFLTSSLEPKRLELVRVLLPQAELVAALVNPDNPNAESHIKDLQAATGTFGMQLLVLKLREVSDFETTFATLVQQRVGAVLVTSDSLFDSNRRRLVDLAARNAIPAMYPWRDFADAGGLLSYGNSLNDAARHVGLYAGRILKGDKAGDLPVWVPTKFEFILNLKTAKALGLEIPAKLLAFADEVIE